LHQELVGVRTLADEVGGSDLVGLVPLLIFIVLNDLPELLEV